MVALLLGGAAGLLAAACFFIAGFLFLLAIAAVKAVFSWGPERVSAVINDVMERAEKVERAKNTVFVNGPTASASTTTRH
jgi:hypothetical protein